MFNIAVCGVGRAGLEVIRALRDSRKFNIVAAFCRDGSEKAGQDIGELSLTGKMGITATPISRAHEVFVDTRVDAVVDFSNPEASWTLLNACRACGVPCVICTTGFTEEELNRMQKLVRNGHMGVVYAPNVTLGINVLMSVLKTVARALPFFDYQITEMHHSRKLDRPSGTAKRIAETLESELPDIPVNHIPINSVRAGGYIGVHEVLAVGEFEKISISHESFSRRAFAQGALMAAEFVINRKGWYYMEDVIDIHSILRKGEFAGSQPNIIQA
jgi:4-hydroxy-tetrahydrodipicolinate reductase